MPSASPSQICRILVVDDEPDLRTLYELTLLREGFRVEAAASVQEARQVLSRQQFEVVITDMRLPDGMGLQLLNDIKVEQRNERCVVITAYGSAENAVESLKAGAFDYLTKPVDLKQFRAVIASAAQAALQAPASQSYRQPIVPNGKDSRPRGASSQGLLESGDAALQRLVGDSAVMTQVKERIAKVARSMAPVLVRGETGTGKELAAKALHANSHRWAGPMVAVNCSAIPENLLESEFFGAKKGAYTGAVKDRIGFFQAASGGTLFLDEIGDLPLSMQSKLLRAIQERSVRPVGATAEENVDVRLVSATHRDLARDVQSGRFRQDLYYRLNVIEIYIPALRDRIEDLPLLCEALLKGIAAQAGIEPVRMSRLMLEQLMAQPLVGNVRELENLLHRAVALCDSDELEIDLGHDQTLPTPMADDVLPTTQPASLGALTVAAQDGIPPDLQEHLDKQERDILARTLLETGYNRTAAATRLGLSLRQIRYRIARLGIDVPHGVDASADTRDDAA